MDKMFYLSPLENNPLFWYLKYYFTSIESYEESLNIYEWVNLEKKVIWKKRLNYALQDFGKEDYEIPQSIWGFTFK